MSPSKMSDHSPKEYFKNKRRYVQVGHLGRGGMAVVSESRDEYFQRNVAFKTLKDGPNRNKRETEFIREAMIMAKLEHPGVVPIHELIIETEDLPSITMGKVKGLSLQEKIKKHKENPESWPLKERLQFFLKFVEIVAYSHNRGVLHRDIKPGNVMIGEVGEVILLDWGLAKVMEKEADEEDEDATVTRIDDSILKSMESMSGSIKGTPYYMSPESAKGRSELVNEQSDVFSLGAVLYELITFEFFIKGSKAMEVLTNASDSNTNPLTEESLNSKIKADTKRVPPEIIHILKKSLEPERLFRYKSAMELQRDLIAYFNDKPIKGFGDGVGLYWIKKWFSRNGLSLLFLTIPILLTVFISQKLNEKHNELESQVMFQRDELLKQKDLKNQKNSEKARLDKKYEALKNEKLEKLDEIESLELDELIIDENLMTYKSEFEKESDLIEENIKLSDLMIKDIQSLDEKVYELDSKYTNLLQLKKRKEKMDDYVEYMKIAPELGAEFQFIRKVVDSGKILSSLEYIREKDLFSQDPFAIHWYTDLLTKRVERIQPVELAPELEYINTTVGGPKFLENAEDAFKNIPFTVSRKLDDLFPGEDWDSYIELGDRDIYYSKSGKVIAYDHKLKKYKAQQSHQKIPLSISRAPNGMFFGQYNEEYLFSQKSLLHNPKVLYHRHAILAYNWSDKGIVLEDELGLWVYHLELSDFTKLGWNKTEASVIEEVEVSFDIDPNQDEKYDEIIPPGYKVVNTQMSLGPWLMTFSGFPKSKFRNLNPKTGEKDPLWVINEIKLDKSLSDGYGGWLVLSDNGELYSLKPGLPAKPLMPYNIRFKKVFPIIEWNISLSQDINGNVIIHYLSTGQYLFNAGVFPSINSVSANAKEKILSLVLSNGKTYSLDL